MLLLVLTYGDSPHQELLFLTSFPLVPPPMNFILLSVLNDLGITRSVNSFNGLSRVMEEVGKESVHLLFHLNSSCCTVM